MPLYDRGARYTQKHEDEARLQQSLANLASARAQGKAAWEAARENLIAAQAVLEQSEAQVRVARRAQQQSDASFRQGVATSVDLTDADNRLFQAQNSAAQARSTVDIRRAEVAAAEGRLYSDAALWLIPRARRARQHHPGSRRSCRRFRHVRARSSRASDCHKPSTE